jgi:hypothetical protein
LAQYAAELRERAGAGARDCGVVALGSPHQESLGCATASLATKRPFFVAFQVMGIDSQVYRGLVLTQQGTTERGTWDSDVWGGSRRTAEHRITWRPCAAPTLKVRNDGVDVDCAGE